MANIKILSEEVANRIAAGEVIERPVSIVKELVENSIDAGATKIVIAIEEGGKKFIQVSDDGYGMDENNALLAFERHATSKIRTTADIFHINTLGFRGEALPSIASISKLTLLTRNKDNEVATKVEFNGGKLYNVSKTAANVGTTITIQKLFVNVPARKKFLKSDQVEYRHILKYIHYQAIVHPEIHFKLISNGRERINYAKANMKINRLKAVLGNDFFKKDIIEINDQSHNINITGYISGLEEEREGFSDYRYIFLNDRYIKDRIILNSIRQAYDPYLKKMKQFMKGQLPPFVIFINVNPEMVDFNVHPAKLEIRFRDPQMVHFHVKKTISRALEAYENEKYSSLQTKISVANSGSLSTSERNIFDNQIKKSNASLKSMKVLSNVYQPSLFAEETTIPKPNSSKPIFLDDDYAIKREEEFVNPWQLHNTYILVQVEDGLMMIDQHAAHERILYEKLIQRMHGAPATSQKLLFPIVLDIPPVISASVLDLLNSNIEQLDKIGFSIKTFSGNSVVIDEIPADLDNWSGGEVFIEILKQLEEEFEETEDFRDSFAKSMSCKAAIKAGKKMGRKEMLNLINDLFACKVPYFCPHGRPLIIKMSITEIEKKFKRIES